MKPKPVILWAVQWRSKNRLDGERAHLIFDSLARGPALFRTRALARAYIEEKFCYIKRRPDLRAEPHGWKMPIAVRVRIQPVR